MAGLVEPATGPPHPARPLPGTAPRGRRHLSASRHSDLVGDSLSRCWFILALGSGTTQPPQTNVPVRHIQANHQTNQLGRDKPSRPILARAVSLVHSLRIKKTPLCARKLFGLVLSLLTPHIITWKRFNNFNTISGQ